MGLIRVILCLIFPPLAVLDKGCGSILLVSILTALGWVPGVLAALVISSKQRLKVVVIGPNGELCEVAQRPAGGVGTLVLAIVLFAIVVSAISSNRDVFQTRRNDGAAPMSSPSTGQNSRPKAGLRAGPKPEVENSAKEPAVSPTPPPLRGVPAPSQEAPPQTHKELPDSASFEGMALPATRVTTDEISLLNEAGKETVIPSGSVIEITRRGDKGTLTMTINGALFVGHESRLLGKTK